MKLVIMRHGEAESFKVKDHLRCLTSVGEKQALVAGKWLAEYLGVDREIDLALVSHYARAEQSYTQLCETVKIKHKQTSDDVVPEGQPRLAHDYIDYLIADNPDLTSIIIVSHMPFVSYFLEEVNVNKQSMLFDTSSMAIVDYDPVTKSGDLETIYHPG